jgi:hypothetical protein
MMMVSASPQALRRPAITVFTALALCVSLLAWATSSAQAQGRSVAIGVGVLGGVQLLNKLAKGGSKSSARSRSTSKSSSSKSKKTYAAKKKSTGSAARSKDDDAPAKSEPAIENAAASAQSPAAPAAATGAAAVATGAAAGTAVAGEAMAISSKSEIRAAQEHLKYMGYDVHDASGTLDLKTKIAIMQFQDSIGEPSTGVMTVKQLQTLFLKVSERTAASK